MSGDNPQTFRPHCDWIPRFHKIAAKSILEINEKRYNLEVKPVKLVSDEWWMKTVKQSGGVIPVALCKYWGELLGMAGGHVRTPVANFTNSNRLALKDDLVKLGLC